MLRYSRVIVARVPAPAPSPITADALRAWRRRHGYSQTRLARALGVSRRSVNRWETSGVGIPPWLRVGLDGVQARAGSQIRTRRWVERKRAAAACGAPAEDPGERSAARSEFW